MKKIKALFGLMLLTQLAFTQTTPDEAVRATLQNHPLARAAALDVQAKKYGEKASFNLPNPEINAESPTGEFYAVGIMQSFEFPTVYARQKQVARAETALAQAGQRLEEYDLQYAVRSLYLEAQVAEFQSRQWAERDSLYQAIGIAAARQFAAGEIDFLQKTLAEIEAGKVQQERLVAAQKAVVLRQLLSTYTGRSDLGTLLPLGADTVGLVAMSGISGNPSVFYQEQTAKLAEQQISLAKSRALPNFSLGYLNQGPRNTPIDYRFRATVGIPLWIGQYRAGTNAAKAESQAAVARAEAQTQTVMMEAQRAKTEAATALLKLRYYERQALAQSRALIAAANRLREAGQVDYVAFLRTLDGAYAVQREYAEQVQALNLAQLRLRYLAGEL